MEKDDQFKKHLIWVTLALAIVVCAPLLLRLFVALIVLLVVG